MSEPAESDTVVVSPRERTEKKEERKRQPPYAVVLHNDDLNTFDFVILCLMKVFGYRAVKATELTLATHNNGRSHVWSGTRELAELKAEQLVSCGPDPVARNASPLSVTVEPLPGE